MRPGTKVSELLCNLCAATGRDIEETRLVLNDNCLRNKDTLAKSGIRRQVAIGVVQFDPWEDVSSLLTKDRDWEFCMFLKDKFAPCKESYYNIKPGDGVKIEYGVNGEEFWTSVVHAENGFVKATVNYDLVTINWPYHKKIRFTEDRIHGIETL